MTTVTVGIPAYNEDKNIGYLLNTILSQKQISYRLKKVIVISDGSTDNTAKNVLEISKHNPIINLIDDHRRLGKLKRLRQLYDISNTDIVIQFDGDVVLADTLVIEKLVNGFSNTKVVLVSGNYKSICNNTFVGKILFRWESIWYQLRKDLNKGDSIRNCLSSILALRSDFAKQLNLQSQFYTTGQFIYCYVKQKKLEFRFIDDAVIYFRIPSTIKEYFSQDNRSTNEKRKLAKFFGNWIYSLYKVPLTTILCVFTRNLLLSPIYTILGTAFFIFPRLFPQKKGKISGIWAPVKSTKEGISLTIL